MCKNYLITAILLVTSNTVLADPIDLYCDGESLSFMGKEQTGVLGPMRVRFSADKTKVTITSSSFPADTFDVEVNDINYEYAEWFNDLAPDGTVNRYFSLNRNTLELSYHKKFGGISHMNFEGTCSLYDPKI
jgi:hypothetical protein